MHIAAIYNLPDNKDELANALAAALGATLYEARSRLRVQGKGPLVVSVSGERDAVEKVVKKLQSSGFDAIALDQDEIESGSNQFNVKKFRLDDEELVVESAGGRSLAVEYRGIDLILRGTCIALRSETRSVKERKFNIGRAALSSGLILTKTTKTTRQVTTEDRQGFFNLYSGNRLTLVFRENALIYDSLGSALKPSRAANFAYLSAELRQRQPDAVFDDRLLRRAEQAILLGPLLSPEESLEVAISLLAKILRQR